MTYYEHLTSEAMTDTLQQNLHVMTSCWFFLTMTIHQYCAFGTAQCHWSSRG